MISIIIPTFNSEQNIKFLLEGIRKTTVKDYEVIIVDDASEDSTVNVCKELSAHQIVQLEQHSGPGRARNVGATHAKGDIIIFMDSDIILKENIDIIHKISEVFHKNNDIDSVASISSIHPVKPNAIAYNNSVYQRYFIEKLLKKKESICANIMFFSTRLGGIRKESFRVSGGFYESLQTVMNEDGEFWTRCYHLGYKTYLDKEFEHYHTYPTKFNHFIRSYFLTAMVQFFVNKKMDTSHDTSISNTEKYRRLLSLTILLSPALLFLIPPQVFLYLLIAAFVLFILSFGKMNKLIWKNVPAKYIIQWYLVYIAITPFIIVGYLYGILSYLFGKRLFSAKPSTFSFFNSLSSNEN